MITIHHGAGYKHTVIELLCLNVKSTVKFTVKAKECTFVTMVITFSRNQLSENQFIQINDRVFKFQQIMDNPERIYLLMQQDLLQDSIEKLP